MHQGKLINIAFAALGGEGGIDGGKEELRLLVEDKGKSYASIARTLTTLTGRTIKRQNVKYWYKVVSSPGGMARTNREEPLPKLKPRKQRRFDPTVNDMFFDGTTILFIADSHAPYHHRDLLAFYKAVRDKYIPELVVHGGDEVDNHALSMHDSDSNLNAAGPELHEARKFMGALAEIFPKMELVESNHGSLVYRRAKKFGIPVEYIRTYAEVLFPGGAPDWTWHEFLLVHTPEGNPTLFKHQHAGDLSTGAAHEGANLCVGHEHAKFGIGYRSSRTRQYWSLYAGCGVDEFSMAQAYGKQCPNRPILGCSVIMNGVPRIIPMCLDQRGRWDGTVH